MKIVRIVFWLIGLGLLVWVVSRMDFAVVGRHLVAVGWGWIPIFFVFALSFLADTLSLGVVLEQARPTWRWLHGLWNVRMVGSAFNNLIPVVGKGGEPLKAWMLKRSFGIGYKDGAAALIITETINLLALVVFVAAGLLVASRLDLIPPAIRDVAFVGLLVFGAAILAFFLIQVLALPSKIAGKALAPMREVEARLVAFYRGKPGRFLLAFVLAQLNAVLLTVEVWVALRYLGHPVTLVEAWTISSVVELVRAAAFVIPAGIGAQETAMVAVVGAITGEAELGMALAVVRRIREVVWIGWGLLIAGPWRAARREEPPR